MPETLIPEEMGFAEFAASLIEETFAAITAAGIDQQAALDRLATEARLDPERYAETRLTYTEVSSELGRVFPEWQGRPYRVEVDAPYQPPDDRHAENPPFAAALGVTLERTDYVAGRAGVRLRDSAAAKIRSAAALRLAEARLAALQGLLRQGSPQVVVDAGNIKARLVFRVVRLEDTDRPDIRDRLVTPLRPLSAIGGISRPDLAGLRFTVRQASDRAPQSSQLSADVFGEVELHFKTVT